ncbi:calcineurin-like phosphoesterase C-terminal domain-containing protein [Methylobacterium sp. A54F]
MTDRPNLTRRQAVAAAAALSLAAGTGAGAQAAPEATGIVYEASTPGAARSEGSRGIPDVLVSNGREIARTDAEGRYRLPMPGDGIVFVIKPAGWALPLGPDNVPRFSYIHQPDGTPPALKLRYRGIEPTGPLPASVDFGLTRAEEPDAFEAILFTDPQPESPTELGHVRDTAVARVLGMPAAFGLTAGDILFDDLSLYGRSNRILGTVGIPWFSLGGNHDLNFEAPDARHSRETYKRVFGAPSYAFHHGRALFIMLDNVRWLGPDAAKGNGNYEGRIGERNLAFVRNLLAVTPQDRLIVLATHIPLVTDVADDARQRTVDRDALLDLLDGRQVLSLAGHTHTTEHHYPRPGHHHHVLTAVSGSWWSGPSTRTGIPSADSRDGTPNGFHVLSVSGTDYATRYHPAQSETDGTMRIVLESQLRGGAPEVLRNHRPMQTLRSPVPFESLGATDLVVNVFDGGPRTRLRYRLDGGAPADLVRTRRPDPFVAELFTRYPETTKSWVRAEPSSHVFTARLPAGAARPGAHRITVEGTDEYGRPIRGSLVLEVTGEG